MKITKFFLALLALAVIAGFWLLVVNPEAIFGLIDRVGGAR